MNKKQLIKETKAFQKTMQGILSVPSGVPYPIKEKANEFFSKLLDYLEDEGKSEEDTKLHNDMPSIKRNLEFLMNKFTNNPTDNQKENIKESKKQLFKSLDTLYNVEVKKK